MYNCCEIRSAFAEPVMSEHERKMVELVMARPASATCELATAMGYENFSGWNLQFGRMCRARFPDAPISPGSDLGFWSSTIVEFDHPNSTTTWRLKPAALHAFRSLGLGQTALASA